MSGCDRLHWDDIRGPAVLHPSVYQEFIAEASHCDHDCDHGEDDPCCSDVETPTDESGTTGNERAD